MVRPNVSLGELDPQTIGVGRPIDPESLEAFLEAFASIMPAEVEFVPRAIPGINYVSAEILAPLITRQRVRTAPSAAENLSEGIAAILFDGDEINRRRSLKPVTAKITAIQYQNHVPSNRRLLMRVHDVTWPYYHKEGYLFEGEKTASLRVLERKRPPTNREPGKRPRALLKLGKVVGDPELVTEDHLERVRKALKARVTVQPIGLVTSH